MPTDWRDNITHVCTEYRHYVNTDIRVIPNYLPFIHEACFLRLTESLSPEGFSINQIQCFTESARRTPSSRYSWGSFPAGCRCATRGGTPRWEHWSADSWVISGLHSWHVTLDENLHLDWLTLSELYRGWRPLFIIWANFSFSVFTTSWAPHLMSLNYLNSHLRPFLHMLSYQTDQA